ncbi:hypothetical protein [Paraburkholderia sp. JPY419]|uniref:hypothetical protein n=1 Tax=Paraburkholderia sp. JPY419 TaxID=667660 RepID=UPI003D1CA6AC
MESIKTFEARLPFLMPCSLKPYIWDLFVMSLGCIRLLKEILDEAVDLAIDEEIERITADILERGNLRLMQRETLAKELLDGFRLIEGRDHPDRTLFEHASSSETNGRKCRPGTRSPTRDPIILGIRSRSGSVSRNCEIDPRQARQNARSDQSKKRHIALCVYCISKKITVTRMADFLFI